MGTITIATIVIMLLSIMLIVVKGFASKEATQESIKEIIRDSTPNQMLAEYKKQLRTLRMCALAGGLLTMIYAMQFFSGGELDPTTWALGQWISVGVGAVVVFAITATQYNLYQDVSGAKTAVFIIIGILFFVFISEIASTSERESELVKSRSMNSPAMKAALSAIGLNTSNIQGSSGYERHIARAQGVKSAHQIELARCKRHAPKGAKRVESCRNYETKKIVEQQAIIDQYRQSSTSRQNAISGNTQALIDKVQVLQQDENQHAAIILFFKGFGISSMNAMMFVAFVLVNAFELGFHYSGSKVGHLKSALAQVGYDLQDETNDFEIQKGKMELLRLRDAAKTKKEMEALKAMIKALSSNDYVGNSSIQVNKEPVSNSPTIGFKLPNTFKDSVNKKPLKSNSKEFSNPVITESKKSVYTEYKNPVITESKNPVITESKNPVITESKKPVITESKVERMTDLYNLAKEAKKGEPFLCPTCEIQLTKKGLKTFCSNAQNKRPDGSNCADSYHNAINPERLKALANKRRKQGGEVTA